MRDRIPAWQNRYAKITHVILGWSERLEQWQVLGIGDSAADAAQSGYGCADEINHRITVGPGGTYQRDSCWECGSAVFVPHQSNQIPLCVECAKKQTNNTGERPLPAGDKP